MQSCNSPWPRAPDCQSVKHCHPALTHFMGHFCLEGNELVVKMLLQALWTSRRVGLSRVCPVGGGHCGLLCSVGFVPRVRGTLCPQARWWVGYSDVWGTVTTCSLRLGCSCPGHRVALQIFLELLRCLVRFLIVSSNGCILTTAPSA